MGKTIRLFEVCNHGIMYGDYFQGCGVSYTEFSEVATGAGMNFAEAIEDCLDQIGSNGYDVSDMRKRICKEIGKRSLPKLPKVKVSDSDGVYYYVSIRYKG